MYTGNLIKELFEVVERAERVARQQASPATKDSFVPLEEDREDPLETEKLA
jgi:hypothetical protein